MLSNRTRLHDFTYLLNHLYNLVDTLGIDNNNYQIMEIYGGSCSFDPKKQLKDRINLDKYDYTRQRDLSHIASLVTTLQSFNLDLIHNQKVKKYLDDIVGCINLVLKYKRSYPHRLLSEQYHISVPCMKQDIHKMVIFINPKYDYEINKSMR